MIREIDRQELIDTFFTLLAETECGEDFDFDNPNHTVWLTKRIDIYLLRGTKFFGCFLDDGTPVGLAGVLIEENPEGVEGCEQKAELPDIAVFPVFRGKGYGSVLLAHAESYARAKGAYCMYLSTDAVSYGTIAFYGKNGYVPVATLPDVHGPGLEGEVYLRKVLR